MLLLGIKAMKKKNGSFNLRAYSGVIVGFTLPIIPLIYFIWTYSSKGKIILAVSALLIYSVFLYILFIPYLEEYYLEYPVIYVKKGRRISKRCLPPEYSIIVSDMSINTAIGIECFPIAGKYYVSIIDSRDKRKIIDILHEGNGQLFSLEYIYGKRYVSSFIEKRFQHIFFDGFIYDRTIPDALFENAKILIIPRSIINHIEHDVLFLPNLFIDEGY